MKGGDNVFSSLYFVFPLLTTDMSEVTTVPLVYKSLDEKHLLPSDVAAYFVTPFWYQGGFAEEQFKAAGTTCPCFFSWLGELLFRLTAYK